ncbi:ras-domain-containing protein [Lepidopterella palustris CBS 459.81]|uniref:Ras-domain-containing protein n=1 Tax=Lepidopterella palustris CBS 459.81 TaxID=1314670 RepID=A0A8E2JK89_9PEZI|nr:ras-domain-containing protein [Lepidopterella palustris CBS 459.81]
MVRQRAPSTASTNSGSNAARDQELGSMYDYLAKIILLGPSGCGKSCLLHRFVKNEWRVLSSQTIGVEFASKIVRVGTRPHLKRIKLQLWDTAGTERFRSVSRSYYRGAAGAILVYDISSITSFMSLPTFLNDARALASPQLTVILAGNKVDVAEENAVAEGEGIDIVGRGASGAAAGGAPATPSSLDSRKSSLPPSRGLGAQSTATLAPEGREVSSETASRWASNLGIPVAVEVSALSGENVDEMFHRLARTILTKIELGDIDPDDPASGIQYGDSGGWGGTEDSASVKSGLGPDEGVRWRRGKNRGGREGWMSGMREWEEVFRVSGRRRRGACC